MKYQSTSPFVRRLVRKIGGSLFRWAENNDDCRITLNGESWLLGALYTDWKTSATAATGERVVFDIGANVGEFTGEILAAATRSRVGTRVIAFEPSPTCQKTLIDRFSGESRFQLVPAAVADVRTRMPLYSPSPGSGHASLIQRDPEAAINSEVVEVLRLDEFLEAHSVDRIDFLKVDVEGAELKVLRGLGRCLNPAQVAMIQFEYGGATLDAGGRLRDLYDLLEAAGYVVGKLMPRAVELRPYAPWMDNFAYANYVAIAPDAACAARNSA